MSSGSEVSLSTVLAMDGDRRASLQKWEQVARGEFTSEVRLWLQHVAEGVVDAESKPAGRLRDSAIVRAAGLAGNVDKHRELREFVSVCLEVGVPRPKMVDAVRNSRGEYGLQPFAYQDLTDHELAKLIGEQLRKFEQGLGNA